MALKQLAQDAKKMTEYQLNQKLDEFFRKNPSFKNLRNNQELIFDLISEYKKKSRRGISISQTTVRRDMYRFYQDRVKLDLSRTDLDDLRSLLESFKS
jgi:hypothetical protein